MYYKMTEFVLVCKTDKVFLNTINKLSHDTKVKFWVNNEERLITFSEIAIITNKITTSYIKSLLTPYKCFLRYRKLDSKISIYNRGDSVKYIPGDSTEAILNNIRDIASRLNNIIPIDIDKDCYVVVTYYFNEIISIEIINRTKDLSQKIKKVYRPNEFKYIKNKNDKRIIDYLLDNIL